MDLSIVLSVVLFATNIFWIFVVISLLNRLMSRNYTEFVMAEKLKKPKQEQVHKIKPDEIDPYQEKRIKEINQLMGMV